LDALDILRHVMVRGLERRAIFTDALGPGGLLGAGGR